MDFLFFSGFPRAGKVKTLFDVWGRSSVGRASRSQCEGRGFDSPRLHQRRALESARMRHAGECEYARRRNAT